MSENTHFFFPMPLLPGHAPDPLAPSSSTRYRFACPRGHLSSRVLQSVENLVRTIASAERDLLLKHKSPHAAIPQINAVA